MGMEWTKCDIILLIPNLIQFITIQMIKITHNKEKEYYFLHQLLIFRQIHYDCFTIAKTSFC